MNSRKTVKILGFIVVAIILIYSFMPGETISYQDTIDEHRQEINDFMKFDEESPLADSLKPSFTGLNYYPVNAEFKVRASLEKIPGRSVVKIPTSDGEIRDYLKFAYASFELKGQKHRLTLLKPLDNGEDRLFLPFTDATNNRETYGGGRYLDLETTTQNKVTIDFNLAYNPYCVYNEEYSCPIPPSENRLIINIEAGEKL